MATEKVLEGKPYAGNPHVRFDEGGSRIGGNAEAWVSTLQDMMCSRRGLRGGAGGTGGGWDQEPDSLQPVVLRTSLQRPLTGRLRGMKLDVI